MHVIGLDCHKDESMIITQKIEYGYVKLEGDPPLVLSVRKELNKPRYTSFTGILDAEQKEIKIVSQTDLDVDSQLMGLDGSPTKMAGMDVRRFERARERLEGSVDDIVSNLVDKIYQFGILK
jgi:electron transfer flavoprotein beta subunit